MTKDERAIRRKVLALRALSESSNSHEAALAAERAQELIEKNGINPQPQNWTELTPEQRRDLLDRLMAEVMRRLSRKAHCATNNAGHDLKPLTQEERELLSTMGGCTVSLNVMRRELHREMEDQGSFTPRSLADGVITRLSLRGRADQTRCRRSAAGMCGAISRACGVRKPLRRVGA